MRELLKSLRQYKKESILAPVFVLLEVIMEVLIPYLMARIIDIGIRNHDINYVMKLGILLIIMSLIALFFGVMAGRYAAIAGAGLSKNLRHDIFYKIQDFSYMDIDKFSSGSLVTRLTTDITNVQMAFMMGVRVLARSPLLIIMALIMTLNINKRISMVFLFSIPLLAFTMMTIARKAHPVFIKVFENYDVLNNMVSENVSAQRVVKAYVREDYESEKFKNISNVIYELYSKAEKTIALNFPIIQLIISTVILLVFYNGGRAIVFGSMTAGQLTSIVVYSIQILMSIIMVSVVFILLMIAEASIDRIKEILAYNPSMNQNKEANQDVKDGSIKFEDVSFSYSDDMNRLALKDINFEIKSGESIGIIGPTGSSKSTLVHLIPRLYDVTKGRIMVGGVDVRDYNLKSLRDSVSMVLQKNTLFTGTVKENLRWADENASDSKIKQACQIASADDFVEEFENKYDEMITEGGNNVSGGQKQRLCIARAILKNPKIIILDDSTSAVDTKTENKIKEAFSEKLQETTKIIISQKISSVENCDRILVLDDGEISDFDTPENLFENNEIYRQMYESQKKGGGVLEQ